MVNRYVGISHGAWDYTIYRTRTGIAVERVRHADQLVKLASFPLSRTEEARGYVIGLNKGEVDETFVIGAAGGTDGT
jgi:hypothetical protein